jgi:hypothetical protein
MPLTDEPIRTVATNGGFPWGLFLLGLVFVAILVAYFWYMRRHHLHSNAHRFLNSVFLEVQVPKDVSEKETGKEPQKEEKDMVAVAEQLYATLGQSESRGLVAEHLGTGEHISFEIICMNKKISFFINCPTHLQELVEKQIQAQYPKAHIEEVDFFNIFKPDSHVAAAEIGLQKKYYYPIRTYKTLETDPLNAITNSFSKLSEDEAAAFQLIITPARAGWRVKPNRLASAIQQGKTPEAAERGIGQRVMHEMGHLVFQDKPKKSRQPGVENKDLSGTHAPITLTPMQQEIIKRLEEKTSRAGFAVNFRLLVSAPNQTSAEGHLRNALSSLMQFSMPPFNGFRVMRIPEKRAVTKFIYRVFENPGYRFILNTEELASLWHLPTKFTETPNVKWLGSKRAQAPINMPTAGLRLGKNSYRGVETEVRIGREDRRRHTYILGRTGSGKSYLMANLAVQDARNGEGFCVIDPHGDLIADVLARIPKNRAEDVVLFEPFDTERPLGLNMLEVESEGQKDFAVQEMISIFYKLVTDPAMLGPMFEHNMRNAMLTLMADKEHPGTITDIPRIFTDMEFQKYKVAKVTDPVVRAFWEKEMAKTSDFHKSEMLGYLVSKVGRFVENSMMRNIVGQAKSGFNFRKIMDEGKILLVNLSKGRVGEINAKLLGLILVSKIQMAALSRADLPEADRKDFYLYVDEFQNFITDAFSSILSEARKYRLNLVMAHQYLGQLNQAAGLQGAASHDLRDAVFGNAGTLITFRASAEDAEFLAKEFEPTFNDFDLVNIDRYNAYVKLMIHGTASKPFNMATLSLPDDASPETAAAIRELSRLKHGRPRQEVENEILESTTLGAKAAGGLPAEPSK